MKKQQSNNYSIKTEDYNNLNNNYLFKCEDDSYH